jgi:3',5'-cyclic AMP phosphodiesterase CpdA
MIKRVQVFLLNFLVIFEIVVSATPKRVQWQSPTTVKDNTPWTFAILSDIHIGDAGGPIVIDLAYRAVNKINELAPYKNTQLVFITGDLSNSALPDQLKEVKTILDSLVVPYFPVIGNHDIWTYNGTWEEKHPTGDKKFAETFASIYQNMSRRGWNYNMQTVWNHDDECFSWFQNWEYQYNGLVFYGLDWNSRQPAIHSLGYKGAMPGAQIYEFPGGTFDWLENRLRLLKTTGTPFKKIVFLQHHPYRLDPWIPDYIYGFSTLEKEEIRNMLVKYFSVEEYWGVFAGHIHTWYNGTAFNEWPTFRQWQTEACKWAGGFTLATVINGEIVDVQKMFP